VGNFQAPQRRYGLNALAEGQRGGLKTEDYSIKRGELRRVKVEEITQGGDFRVAGGVRMDADGPKAARFLDRSPELLRNPGQASPKERDARKTVG